LFAVSTNLDSILQQRAAADTMTKDVIWRGCLLMALRVISALSLLRVGLTIPDSFLVRADKVID
jgi:hypothetical protein